MVGIKKRLERLEQSCKIRSMIPSLVVGSYNHDEVLGFRKGIRGPVLTRQPGESSEDLKARAFKEFGAGLLVAVTERWGNQEHE